MSKTPSPTPTMVSFPEMAMFARLVTVTVIDEPPRYGIVKSSLSTVIATTEFVSHVASIV